MPQDSYQYEVKLHGNKKGIINLALGLRTRSDHPLPEGRPKWPCGWRSRIYKGQEGGMTLTEEERLDIYDEARADIMREFKEVGMRSKERGDNPMRLAYLAGKIEGHQQDVEWLDKHFVGSEDGIGLRDEDWQAFKDRGIE